MVHPVGVSFQIVTDTAPLDIENDSGGDEVADHSLFSIFKGVYCIKLKLIENL